ncbi:mitogen-activated protein kinase kinase kinase [Coemansia brasiliensis]|uniref:Mitogen-activated protein kinase kinase kinase n=1 Tax=Coemansia brasiliensis TaxID=2650707 RepID=A0A9W8I8A3_9FUNG|nr:mitogen-activated protein kinase kinase kinase [Coemansia brasiliensis]
MLIIWFCIEHGIEGYRFYTLKLEDLRGMRIPGVTMQELIQLNAAIYRLNVACATPANRSHMTGTVKVPPTTYRPPANSVPQTYNYQSTSAQILSQPLQPLRPPRPSWTLRHDDPQPTYMHQLTSNGMVARPVRPLQVAQKDGSAAQVPFAINTGTDVTRSARAALGTAGSSSTSNARTWTPRTTGRSPRSPPFRDTSGERAAQYSTAASSKYRSSDSAHVEVDELPMVRPGPATWAARPPKYGRPAQPQQQLVRRRSAVVDIPEDPNPDSIIQRTPSSNAASLSAQGNASTHTLPARYHGTNHPHSPYYAHGASGTYAFRSTTSPASARPTFAARNPHPADHLRPKERAPIQGMFDASPNDNDGRQKTAHTRRTSISPVLSALQPGNYHIANLPDDLDDSSDVTNTSSEAEDPPILPPHVLRAQQQLAQRQVHGTHAAQLPAINTAALMHEFRTSPCETGDSTVTPLSVVNVLPGTLSTSTSPSQHSQHSRIDSVDARFQPSYTGADNANLPAASYRYSHSRTPSAPLSFPALRESTILECTGNERPQSSAEIRLCDEPAIFDADSIASNESIASFGTSHFDLVENAAPIDSSHAALSIMDAEEIGEQTATFDAEELMQSPAIMDAEEIVHSPVIMDAEEIVQSPAIFDAEEMSENSSQRSSVIVDAYEAESIMVTDEIELTVGPSALSIPVTHKPTQQQQQMSPQSLQPARDEQSPTFKLKGVRQVLSYDADFDKTAATLLSSIKTDIAKKAATSSTSSTPETARIAAAIEHHQQKQRQKQIRKEEGPSPTTSESKYTSRLSGFFGFAQRSQPKAETGAGGLRVVTDLNTLRNHSTGNHSAGDGMSSGEAGRKSSSPSTLPRRWRVPFRQRPQTASAQPEEAEPRRAIHRRSRYRAGTTSDIESPHTARVQAGERPSSMVESGSSSGSSSASPATMAHVVLARTENSNDFVPVSIARLVSGASVAERLVRKLYGGAGETLLSPSRWRFAAVLDDSTLQPIASESDLWVHCVRARPDSPAKFMLYDARDRSSSTNKTGLRIPVAGANSPGSEASLSDLEEICSAVPIIPPRIPAAASPGLSSGGSLSPSPFSGDIDSPSSFVTARTTIPGAGVPAPSTVGNEAGADSDSWTLMFFNKEFVVPKGISGAPSQTTLGSSSTERLPETLSSTGISSKEETAVNDKDEDDLLWGGAAPAPDDDSDDLEAAAVRADLIRREPSVRELPSSWRFTRGMRATLLKRPSTNKKVHQRPTADVIGEQLDEYFPDHDLDRPIVQAVPVDDESLPSQEFHIIMDDAYGGTNVDKQQRKQPQAPTDADGDSRNNSNSNSSGIGRRKSVRMLVQETRWRRGPRNRSRPVQRDQRPEPPAMPQIELDEPSWRPATSGIVRRKSTRMWGCIPEEIRPATQQRARPAEASSSSSSSSSSGAGSDEIVRRALSLLRKPEPNPEAEKEIVEAAMRCEDGRAVGTTRAQFERDREQQWREEAASATSVSDTVRSLFAKYNMGPAGVRFQWIRGKLIGRGSFGHVYVGINAGTGEVIAVKQIRLPTELRAAASGSGKLADAVQMMQTEVELLRDLDHEHIVQLLGVEVTPGLMSMFLEYVPGGTVQSLVQQHGPLPEAVVHSFVAQITAGLAYLHERAILHRDIKGANILVDHTGTCKISDFGISRKIDRSSVAEAGRRRRHQRKILGTVPFMAPEIARASEYSEAADIWALGCVVVQMWSGRQPWDELQEPQVFFKLGRGEAPPIPDDLTAAGLEFCKHCFVSDPQARWPAVRLASLDFAKVPSDYEYPYNAT